MRTRISERKLLISIILLAGAMFLLFTASFTNARVRIPESGRIALVAAMLLLLFAIRFFLLAIKKA